MIRKIIPLNDNTQNSAEPTNTVNGTINLPGSKYIANRLLPLCALADSPSELFNLVNNDDINTAISGLNRLGYQLTKTHGGLLVQPHQNMSENKQALIHIDAAHSGTFSRFVSVIAALGSNAVKINCSAKMATRPMHEIFEALTELGVSVESSNQCLPAIITGPIKKDVCLLDASRSSQYLSALLMVAALLPNGLKVQLTGSLVSRAYVDMTIKMMALMGVTVVEHNNIFSVAPGQRYSGVNYRIPCDPVSATYFMAAAVIGGGQIVLNDFDFDSPQGESNFYSVLKAMGASVVCTQAEQGLKQLKISCDRQLNAIEVDMGNMPDAVQTLAVVACFAKGATRIYNIAHLAYKESNRILDTAKELRKTGIKVETGDDYMIIHGGKPQAAKIDTHEDHRMAMSMALLGIITEGILINDAEVVSKSFPDYWDYLTQIGLRSEVV